MSYRQATDPAGCAAHVLPWQAIGDPSGPCHHFDHDHGRPSDLYGICDPHHLVDDVLARVTDTEVYHVVSGLPDQYRSYLLRMLRMDPQENVSPFTAARLRHHFQSVADPRVRVVGSVLLSGPVAEIVYNSEGLDAEPLALLVGRDPRGALSVLMRWPVLDDDLSAAAGLPTTIRQLGLAAAYAANAPLGVLALGWLLAEGGNLPELLVTAIRAAWRQATHWSPTLPQDPLPIPQCSADARRAHLAYRGRAEGGGNFDEPTDISSRRDATATRRLGNIGAMEAQAAAQGAEEDAASPSGGTLPSRESPQPGVRGGPWVARIGGPNATREVDPDVSPNVVSRLSGRLSRRTQQNDQVEGGDAAERTDAARDNESTGTEPTTADPADMTATRAFQPPQSGPPRTDFSPSDFSGTDVADANPQEPAAHETAAESAKVRGGTATGRNAAETAGELGSDIGVDGAPRDVPADEPPPPPPRAEEPGPDSETAAAGALTEPIPMVEDDETAADTERPASARAGEWSRQRGRAVVPSGPRGWLGPSRVSGPAIGPQPAPADSTEDTPEEVPVAAYTDDRVPGFEDEGGLDETGPDPEARADVPSPEAEPGEGGDRAEYEAAINALVGRFQAVREALSRAYAALEVEQAPDPADVAALTALSEGFGVLSSRLTRATGFPIAASIGEFRAALAEIDRQNEQRRTVILLERLQGLSGPDALAGDIARVRALAVQTADALRTVQTPPTAVGAHAGAEGHDGPDPVSRANGQPSILDGLVALTELVELVSGAAGNSGSGRHGDVTDPRIAPASTFHRMVELEDTVRAALSDVVRPVLAAAVIGGLHLPEVEAR